MNIKHLDTGAHTNPDEGLCLMEAVSLLADENFSDRPRCACPEITSFLHHVNDTLGDAQRDKLIPYAPYLIGTTGREREHATAMVEWAEEMLTHVRPVRRLKRPGEYAAAHDDIADARRFVSSWNDDEVQVGHQLGGAFRHLHQLVLADVLIPSLFGFLDRLLLEPPVDEWAPERESVPAAPPLHA